MHQRILSFLAGTLALFALTTCHPLEPYQTERFDLTAGPCAAEGYPMEVVEGRFLTSDGKSFAVAPEFLEGDWGLAHSSYVGGDGTAPAPDSLEVRWFSYTEDKFYEGHWLLPQRRIHDLLLQGYWNTDDKKHETYHKLTLCFLPKGVVVVWMVGSNQVLLGRYEGHEIAYDFKRFNEAADRPLMIKQEQAKLPAAVQQQIRSGTLSTRQWDDYLKKYDWHVAFRQPLTLYNYGIGYLNSEDASYPLTPDMAPYLKTALEPGLKSAPRNIFLWVDAGYGRQRQIQVRKFNEEETLGAFQTLHAANPTLPLSLYFDTDERVRKGRLFLKNDRQQVELRKSEMLFFDAE